MGGLDILINNAGIETMGSVTTAQDDEWERQINVNLNGVYRVSRFAVPKIIEAGRRIDRQHVFGRRAWSR